MKRWAIAALAVLVCTGGLAAAGLRGGGAEPVPEAAVAGTRTVERSWATPPELAWVSSLLAWQTTLHRRLESALRLAAASRLGAARTASTPVRRCSSSLREVGRPPSERTVELRDRARKGCRAYESAFDRLLSSRGRGEDAVGFVRSELDQGAAAFDALVGLLPLGAHRDLPARNAGTGASHVETRFSRAASEVAGKELEVRCWSAGDWRRLLRERRGLGDSTHDVDGFALVGGGRVHLSPYLCSWLAAAAGRRLRTERDEAAAGYSLLALAHEAQHSTGVADEGTATCHALQTAPELTYALDVPRAAIDRLVAVFWREYNGLPREYRSPACREGGALDLSPGDGRWP
jgi:hypothetical protein